MPASTLGPSAYDTASGSVLTFDSLSVAGSACTSSEVTLNSLSLFGGAVRVGSVRATDGTGTVEEIEIDGAPVNATAGETIGVGDWGRLTLGAVVGRVRAPLVFRLLQARNSLPAGTAIAVAFSAVAKRKPGRHVQSGPQLLPTSQAPKTLDATNHQRGARRPPPDFPRLPDPFLFGGALAPAFERNPVVSIAMQYLGVPYRWGGASPKTGFDCSGLVKYVFAQLGVYLPHYATSQYYWPETVPVSPKHLRAGDLVFFVGSDGTRIAPGHVGIYVGDGYLIDAPHTGAFVEIDRLDARWFANEYVGARRVVGLAPDDRRLVAPADGTAVPPIIPLLAQPLLAAAALPPGAHSPAPQTTGLWTFGGILVFLAGAALTFRRRRRTSAERLD